MALITVDEFDSRSRTQAGNYRFKGFEVRSDLTAGMLTDKTEEKIGTVAEVLVDESGLIQYVVVDLGVHPSGRQVLLPADRAQIDNDHQRVYASGLTKDQAEHLPEFSPRL